MRKKPFWIVLMISFIIILLLLGGILNEEKQTENKQGVPIHSNSLTQKTSLPLSRSLFVPYWVSEANWVDYSYDLYYYFGIRPTRDGSVENEVGLQNIPLVNSLAKKQKKLVLRMLDTGINEVLLQDKTAQKKLASAVKGILSKYAFSGIILDIEIPFTLKSDKKEQITKFVQVICTAIKTDYKTCGMLIYGDFAFRNRPYDLKKLGESTDTILLMAYDFHKAGGEPGPNFPLDRRNPKGEGSMDYGYDFKQMISDATAIVPRDKIEVVFGMYGYDWTLNEQGTPLKTAKALSLKEIQAFISNDKSQITNQSYITSSKEKHIKYTDSEGQKHLIWFEDEESVKIKTDYLKEQGIGRVSFWAHSYF